MTTDMVSTLLKVIYSLSACLCLARHFLLPSSAGLLALELPGKGLVCNCVCIFFFCCCCLGLHVGF